MLDESRIERTGDVLEWLFRSAMKVIGPKKPFMKFKEIDNFDVFSLNGYQPMWNYKRRSTAQMRRSSSLTETS